MDRLLRIQDPLGLKANPVLLSAYRRGAGVLHLGAIRRRRIKVLAVPFSKGTVFLLIFHAKAWFGAAETPRRAHTFLEEKYSVNILPLNERKKCPLRGHSYVNLVHTKKWEKERVLR
jgi:hypothetical protein